MDNFTKIIRIGTRRDYAEQRAFSVFCKITWTDGRLSITGVEGPTRDGNAIGGCGQIVMSLTEPGTNAEWVTFADGWDLEKARAFLAVWDRWHLNDMQAGDPEQRAYLRANPVEARGDHYTAACAALAAAGLHPNPATGYRYGSGWLREEVPADVLDYLRNLPDTDRTPAWV